MSPNHTASGAAGLQEASAEHGLPAGPAAAAGGVGPGPARARRLLVQGRPPAGGGAPRRADVQVPGGGDHFARLWRGG